MTDDTTSTMREAQGSVFVSPKITPVPTTDRKIAFDGEELLPEQIPQPVGYRMIVAPISIDESTSGGIIITRVDQKMLEHIRFVGKVLAMGSLCYRHEKFKAHPDASIIAPWCKVGDIITTGQYTGSQIPCRVDGKEFNLRVINDDEVMTVVQDLEVLNV